MRLRTFVLALCAVVAGAGATDAARAARRPPIKTRTGRSYVPKTGDWEGTVGGFPASFQLVYAPRFASTYNLPPYGFEDLVMLEPSSCPVSQDRYFESFIAEGTPSPVRAGGSFGLSPDHISGGLTGARGAKLAITYNISASPSASRCKGHLRWTLHPARRRPVKDGTWQLHFSDGESESFTVRAGGRVATGIGLPSAIGGCGGPVGGVDLFIHAGGLASYREGQALKISLAFRRRTATGQLTVPAGSCPALKMSARLASH